MSEVPPCDFPVQVTASLPRPSTMTRLEELALQINNAPAPPVSSPPHLSTTIFTPQQSAYDDESAENVRLREENANLRLDARICEEELNTFRSNYYAERFKANVRKRLTKSLEANFAAQTLKLEQAEKFISSLIEVGLHQPVLVDAWRSVDAGQIAEDALVDAIKKAALVPGTSWSRIIPAVIGPRTSDEYLGAIDLALKITQDLKNTRKIAKFWKSSVKNGPSQKDIVTPSPSELSDTSFLGDVTRPGQSTAVDDLLKQLRSGGLHATKFTPPVHILVPTLSPNLPVTIPHVPVPSVSPDMPLDVRDLAPLASQVLKGELAVTHSGKPRASPPSSRIRPIFGKIDPHNHDQKPKLAARKGTEKQGTRTMKNFNKRNAMHVKRIIPTRTSENTRPFSPENALQSLERICAGFSSGSLGSLRTTNSDSTELQRSPSGTIDVNSNSIMSGQPQIDVRYKANAMSGPTLRNSYSLKASALPRLKVRKPASPSSRLLSSVFQPANSPSSKMKSTSVKKMPHKNTSPLRITKKTLMTRSTVSVSTAPSASRAAPVLTPPASHNGRFGSKGRSAIRSLSQRVF